MSLPQNKIQCNSSRLKPWITSGLIKSIRHKNTLYRNYLLNRETALNDKYLKYKNKLTHLIRTAEKTFISINLFLQNKTLIKHNKAITNLESHKTSTLNEIIANNTHVTDKQAISANFNEYCVHIGPIFAPKYP